MDFPGLPLPSPLSILFSSCHFARFHRVRVFNNSLTLIRLHPEFCRINNRAHRDYVFYLLLTPHALLIFQGCKYFYYILPPQLNKVTSLRKRIASNARSFKLSDRFERCANSFFWQFAHRSTLIFFHSENQRSLIAFERSLNLKERCAQLCWKLGLLGWCI